MMGRAEDPGFHFMENNLAPQTGSLPGGFTSSQSSTDYYEFIIQLNESGNIIIFKKLALRCDETISLCLQLKTSAPQVFHGDNG